MPRTYVIVGASLTGATAAITLRDAGADHKVILIGAERDAPYERPPLSKHFLRGSSRFESALVRPSAFYADHRIDTMFSTRVTRIEPTARLVETEDGRQVSFDALLIATGGRSRHLQIPGTHLDGIYTLRTRQDAERIRAEMAQARRAVVVGMGFIGSEVAASLRLSGLDVVAIAPSTTPLFRVLGEAVGRTLAALHHEHGVRTIFEDTVTAFEGTGRVDCVVTGRGERVDCDFVVLGIGTDPVVDLLDGTGITVDKGVHVDEYCQTSASGIYAAGDVANFYHPLFGQRMRVEHWSNAMRQGAVAAHNMLGQHVAYDEVPWFWSEQYDTTLQYAGFHSAWERLVVRGTLEAGNYLACYVNEGRVDAVVGMNRAKDVRRMIPIIRARRPVDLDRLQDEAVDLRTLHQREAAA